MTNAQVVPREAGSTSRQLQDISTAAVTEAVSLMASAIAQVIPEISMNASLHCLAIQLSVARVVSCQLLGLCLCLCLCLSKRVQLGWAVCCTGGAHNPDSPAAP